VTAALVILAQQPEPTVLEWPERPAIEPASVSAPMPLWQPIVQPATVYAVDATDLQSLPFTYAARRDSFDAREDALTFGAAEADGRPHFRLVAHRSPEPQPTASFFVDLARRAADAGLAVARSAPADGLRTKFGTAEAADVVLAGGSERACLAFRFAHQDIAWRLGGWLCGTEGRPAGRRQLACLLDSVSLRAADDASLKVLFAQAERQRDPTCAAAPQVAEAPKPAAPPRNGRRR
jgi:hypothetical protein